jgi:carboxymethylenebutenolidase
MVSFKSGTDVIGGYLARPKATGQYRAVLVLHGEFGVPEGMRNTAAQLAQAGFVGLAYKRFGRWPELTPQDLMQSDQTDKRFLSGSFVDQELRDAQAAIDHFQAQPFIRPGGVGVIGFCGGGYEALLLATRSKDVRAVVAFYAPPVMKEQYQHPKDPKPSLMDKVGQINVPVQGHYGADDPLVLLEDVRKFGQALKAQGTPASFFTYAGATHGFYDYSRRFYHAGAAARAKGRMLDFLREHLP